MCSKPVFHQILLLNKGGVSKESGGAKYRK